MTTSCPKKPNIAEISPHLICALCGGYLIDATTIVECLHSFCKTCIVRYLESSKYCPICEVLVHKTRPLQNIRLDHTLQNIVYKLVPGLFQNEMARRREFYKDSPTVRSAQTRLEQQRDRVIYSADEKFSVALEFCPDGRIRKPTVRRRRNSSKSEPPDRRYLLCPANTTIALLKKFMKLKFFLNEKFKVDIFHSDGNLRDHYQLMDVAYIYSYKREGVLQLYYSVQKVPIPTTPKIEILEVKDEPNSQNETGNGLPNLHETRGIPNLDDNRPSSLFSKASLLNHRIDGNIEHDLSPLELIATVANDLSSYQEGRGLKRKADEAELFENDEESSNSKEIQIQKSIEHAIDICSSNSNHGNQDATTDKISVTTAEAVSKSNSKSNLRTVSPGVSTEPSASLKTTNKQKCIKTGPNLFENLVNKLPKKEKPKTTDTASQCEPRPKKQKTTPIVNTTTQLANQHSSRSPTKVIKSTHPQPSSLPHPQQQQQQQLQQQTHHPNHQSSQQQQQLQQNKQQSQKSEPVQNHITQKTKSQTDLQNREEKINNKVNNNNNNNNNNTVEHNNCAITKAGDSKSKGVVGDANVNATQTGTKVSGGSVEQASLPVSSSSVTCHKTSVIKTNNSESLKSAGVGNPAQTNGFTSIVNATTDKATAQSIKAKQTDKE